MYWHRNDYLVVLVLIEAIHVWWKIKAWHDIVVLDNTNTNLRVSIIKKNTSSLSEHHLYISHQHSQKSHILSQSNLTNQILQQTMAFLGEISNQTIVNSILTFIFLNGAIIHNETGVYFQNSTLMPIRVPNDCGFQKLKRRMHNTLQLTDNKYLDEIY